ncbi:hypothetical protein AMTR_s00023p00147290 [Amborella trichopoda]|uniref:Uncharacterized protein n=1 Tax=Amborella trichopoda TaxID=13333 RepID=W1NJC1_AMBTC|nr:hypothetical protein AMTR_s00023p00147290 [Amborella trichopoda]
MGRSLRVRKKNTAGCGLRDKKVDVLGHRYVVGVGGSCRRAWTGERRASLLLSKTRETAGAAGCS